MAPEGPSRWKSRFSTISIPSIPSLSSFLPTRHPPLDLHDSHSHSRSHYHAHPVPTIPKQYLPRKPTVSITSPVQSEYPSPSNTATFDLKSPPILPPLPIPTFPPRIVSPKSAYSGQGVGSARSGTACTSSPPVRKRGSPRRPPPLDLGRTKALYPAEKATNELSPVLPAGRKESLHPQPALEDLASGKRNKAKKVESEQSENGDCKEEKKKKKRRVPRIEDDPFDVAVIDVGHKYTSWKSGKVDIKPGQVIPRGALPILQPHTKTNTRSTTRNHDGSSTESLRRGGRLGGDVTETYESVLHNVLLTPTYLDPSPIPPGTPSPSDRDRGVKRKTLIDRAGDALSLAGRRGSKWMPKGILKHHDDRSANVTIQKLREREQAQMDRFRQGSRHVPLVSPRTPGGRRDGEGYPPLSRSYSVMASPGREGVAYARRSPGWLGRAEETVEGETRGTWKQPWLFHDRGETHKEGKSWRERKKDEEKAKRKQKIWKYSIILIILCLAALIIGLCTSLLTRSSSSSSSSTDSSASSSSASGAASSPSASQSSAISSSLSTCLSKWSSASASPTNYPCSDCVPVLSSTTNDYDTPLVNGNSTGVGAALQFCAMMDVYWSSNQTALGADGWAKNASPCGWKGATCDARGRITQLQMTYPDVPSSLSSTLGNIVSLQQLHMSGNGTVPGGALPSTLLSLSNLTTLDLESTGLTAPISSLNWSAAPGLETIYLSNNAQLGTTLPSFSSNTKLVTLAVTGQGINSWSADMLASSLTYLDLSYNSLSGQVPSFSQLTTLQTLFLENNAFTTSPSSLPSALSTLSLTSNSNLSGTMPQALCSSATLTSCDLRSTKLSGATTTTSSTSSTSSNTSQSSSSSSVNGTSSTTGSHSSTSAAPSASASAGSSSCGVCKFT